MWYNLVIIPQSILFNSGLNWVVAISAKFTIQVSVDPKRQPLKKTTL